MANWFLDDIRYFPDSDSLLQKMRLERDSDEAEEFLELLEKIAAIAKPKAFVGEARVAPENDGAMVDIGGFVFRGDILYENVKELETVWPYLATCGGEAYALVQEIGDPVEKIWGEMILEDMLRVAEKAMNAFVAKELYSGKIAAISPGSLPEWPIEQQAPLFRLLAGGAEKCGVSLTGSMLMIPNKSISGFLFPNEHGYVSCRLCPRDACPGRRAAYEPQAPMSAFG